MAGQMAKQDRSAGRDICSDIPLEDYSKVVEAIYDCALEPDRWQDAVRMVAELSRSQWCVLGAADLAKGHNELIFRHGFDEEFWRLHETKYKGMNPYPAPLMLQPTGAVATGAMLADDREVFESRFYLELCKPYGLCDSIGFKALQTDHRLVLFSANRIEPSPRYDDAAVRLFTLLSPHVCRAVAISDVLDLQTVRSAALEATLDALATSVYLIGRHGRVVYMNRTAEHQVRTTNAFRIEHDLLIPVDRSARMALANAIDGALVDEARVPAAGVTFAVPDRETAGLVATVLPLARGERRSLCSAFAAVAAVFVQDPIVVPPFPGEAFAKLYDLTGSELRVLLAMAPGLSVKEAAEMLGIGETTAKTHLQRIYIKTGTSKQTELMHLFMSSTPPVRAA
jgi:DNA-binding CsgD family transcriptional regulator